MNILDHFCMVIPAFVGCMVLAAWQIFQPMRAEFLNLVREKWNLLMDKGVLPIDLDEVSRQQRKAK